MIIKRILLLLALVPCLCGWTFYADDTADFSATSNLTNDTTSGGQFRANFIAGSDGSNTYGQDAVGDQTITEGETIYFHVDQYIPTGFDATAEDASSVRKWWRLQYKNGADAHVGYASIMMIGTSSGLRPYFDIETPLDIEQWRSTDTLPWHTADTWQSIDAEMVMGDDSDGSITLSFGGTTRTEEDITTMSASHDTWDILYLLSYWNGNVNANSLARFKNIYISNEEDYATYSGSSPVTLSGALWQVNGSMVATTMYVGGDVRAVSPPAPETDGFVGYSTDSTGGLYNGGTNDGVWGVYTATESGTISRMAIVLNNTTTSNHFSCAIYNSTGTTRLGYTASTVVQESGNTAWNYADLVTPITITSGTSYLIIGGISDDGDWQSRGTTTGSTSINYDTTWTSADSSVDNSGTEDATAELCIFADNGQTFATDYTDDSNCAGAWYMNANTGNETDRSDNSETLTESGGSIPTSATVPSGYDGTSRDFEAGDTEWVQASDGGSTDINGADQAMSISAWIRPESIGSGQPIVAKWLESGNQRQFRFRISSGGSVGLEISSDGSASSNKFSTTDLSAGTWYHAVAVYDDTDIEIYINGVSEGSPTSYTSGVYNGSDEFYVGRDGDGNYFDGLIDEVIIFDRALSSTEISDIYNDGIDGTKGAND